MYPKRHIISLVFVTYALLVGVRLFSAQGIPTYFSVVGEQFVDEGSLPDYIKPVDEFGYDGQFFLRSALNPWTAQAKEFGMNYDKPTYRHARIFYPLSAYVGTLLTGKSSVGYWLILLNFLAVVGVTYISLRFCESFSLPNIWALLPVGFSGIALALGRNLAEPYAIFWVIASLFYFQQRSYFIYALLISLAILTRESALITACGMGLAVFYTDRFKFTKRVIFCLIPAVVFLSWNYIEYLNWGIFPFADSPPNREWPLQGLVHEIFYQDHLVNPVKDLLMFFYLGWQVVFGGIVLRILSLLDRKSPFDLGLLIGFIIWTLFIICLGSDVWRREWGFSRILLEWNLLGFLILLTTQKKIPKWFAVWTATLFAISFLRLSVKV